MGARLFCKKKKGLSPDKSIVHDSEVVSLDSGQGMLPVCLSQIFKKLYTPCSPLSSWTDANAHFTITSCCMGTHT